MYKMVELTGTEIKVDILGWSCDIRNDSTETVYASTEPGIIPGADGVYSIPPNNIVKILDIMGSVYLLGTGAVMLCGHDSKDIVF